MHSYKRSGEVGSGIAYPLADFCRGVLCSCIDRHFLCCAEVNDSDLDALEHERSIGVSREIGVDLAEAGDSCGVRGGANQVGPLHEFHPPPLKFQPCGVEGAALMRDEHQPAEFVDLDEESQLVYDAVLFEACLQRLPAGAIHLGLEEGHEVHHAVIVA